MRLSWSLVPKFTALDWELEEEEEEREGRRKGRPNLGELWKHSRGGACSEAQLPATNPQQGATRPVTPLCSLGLLHGSPEPGHKA